MPTIRMGVWVERNNESRKGLAREMSEPFFGLTPGELASRFKLGPRYPEKVSHEELEDYRGQIQKYLQKRSKVFKEGFMNHLNDSPEELAKQYDFNMPEPKPLSITKGHKHHPILVYEPPNIYTGI